MRIPRILVPALLAPALLQAAPRVQSPDAPWKTFRTAHYRIHFPASPGGDFEPFAREIASKVEGIHVRVTEWVGYEARGPIDILVRDPQTVERRLALGDPFLREIMDRGKVLYAAS